MILGGPPDAPLYRRVYETLRTAILDGSLPAGTRLPGTRTLATDLGVSRMVVLIAFEQLAAETYIVAKVGSGTRVAVTRKSVETGAKRGERAGDVVARGRMSRYAMRARTMAPHRSVAIESSAPYAAIDFGYADTNPDLRTIRMWRRAPSRAVVEAPRGYPDPAGSMRLRIALAEHLREARGVIADPERILIVSGSQQALDLTARVVCDVGTVIGIEDPHYQGTRSVFAAAGARVTICSTDDEGLDIELHAKRLRRAAAVCVTPSHQFPTGAMMPVERRLRLLDWAERHGSWIIEDDYDWEFRYRVGAIPALQGLDTAGRVIYMGTFARTLFPALRLGYVVVPPALLDAFRAVKWLADRGSPLTSQHAMALLLESGDYHTARRRMARQLGAKRDILLDALQSQFPPDEIAVSGASSGAHLYVRLKRLAAKLTGVLIDAAAQRGVRVYDARPYHAVPPRDTRLILGYTTVAEDDIERGIAALAECYRSVAASAPLR